MLFSYLIVPGSGHEEQALVRGNLYVADIETAKRHVQTVLAPGLVARAGLEVILQDGGGTEIWRGPYLGSAG